MTGGADPRRRMDGETDVAAVGQRRAAGVDADPEPDGPTGRPGAAPIRCWIPTAAWSAADARSNAAKYSSARASISCPPERRITVRRMRRVSARIRGYASPDAWSSPVDPSMSDIRNVTLPGRQTSDVLDPRPGLTLEALVLAGQPDGGGDRGDHVGIAQDRRRVDEGGHRSSVALEQGDGAVAPVDRQPAGAAGPIDVAFERLRPLEDLEGRIAEDRPEAVLEAVGFDRLELDDQTARVDRPDLRTELTAEEADRDDPVPLGRPQQPGPRPIARLGILEAGLVEPRQRVPDVRLVVDRQPPAAGGVHVGEGAVGQSGPPRRVQLGHRP